jgi:hypothetical protein
MDQHIDFIVERTGIMKGVNDYLATKFLVKWSSRSSAVRAPKPVEQRNKIIRWLRRFGTLAAEAPLPAAVDSGTYRVHRMILKVKDYA